MPLLGFTKLKSKLLDGSKTQTIRKPRKYPLKVGDKLFVYWKLRTKECEKLGEARITSIVRKPILEVTEDGQIVFTSFSPFDAETYFIYLSTDTPAPQDIEHWKGG